MHRLLLLILLTALLTSNCSKEAEFQTYTLDVSNIARVEGGREDYLLISHNAVAVFPLNLSNQTRTLAFMGPSTIIQAQTLSVCSGTGRERLPQNHEIIRNIDAIGPIQTVDAADVRKITLEMPYASIRDTSTRIPGTLCVGFHLIDSGWVWNFAAVTPELNDIERIGVAEVIMDESNVDVIGILFDATISISKITFEARKAD